MAVQKTHHAMKCALKNSSPEPSFAKALATTNAIPIMHQKQNTKPRRIPIPRCAVLLMGYKAERLS